MARLSTLPVVAGPFSSVPLFRDRVAVVPGLAVYFAPVPTRPVTVTDPPVGPSTSSETLTTLALVLVRWLPTLSGVSYSYL